MNEGVYGEVCECVSKNRALDGPRNFGSNSAADFNYIAMWPWECTSTLWVLVCHWKGGIELNVLHNV